MIIKQLIIHNFFTFEHVDIELGEGPFFITGNNRDSSRAISNGAGKSMFIQSIIWCWFDDLLREGVLKDDVVGPFDEYCRVYVKIEKDGKLIEIDRVRKHKVRGNSVQVKLDGENISKHKDKDNISTIENILGISLKTVYYSCYSSRATPSFMMLSPSKMKETVSEILDISRFDKHIVDFAKKAKNLKIELDKIWVEHRLTHDQKKEAQRELFELEAYISNFRKTNILEISKLGEKIKEFNKEIASISSKILEQDELRSTILQRDEIKEVIDDVEKINNKLKEYESYVSKNLREKERCMTDISSFNSKIDSYTSQIANLSFSSTGRCEFCNSEMKDHNFIKKKLEELNKLLESTTLELEVKRTYFNKVSENISSKEIRIKEFKDFLKETQQHYNLFMELENKIKNNSLFVKSLEEYRIKIAEINSKIEEINNSSPQQLMEMKETKERYISKLELKIIELENAINLKDDQITYSEEISTSFKELKSGIFNNFVLEFCNSINNNLEDLTDGVFKCAYEVKGEELKFMFTDSSKNGRQLPFSAFSDGERCLISKAVSASLSEIINTGIIIDDEGLDGADSSVIPFIVEFILNKYKGRSFFFVGHQTILSELFQGYSNLHIVKENGKSKVYKNE